MARIRTIKPEFWTDSKIVQLPYEARLLFIGLWNFADDYGVVEYEADRLQLQIFPADPTIDVAMLVDALVASGLVELLVGEEKDVIVIRNWSKHQRVDNPSKTRIAVGSYRKLAIPSEARRAVAIKYGCSPGGELACECYFCGAPGKIHWFKRRDGKPGAWVCFSGLELDHFEPEKNGGKSSENNIVLSCRYCNRSRKDKHPVEWSSQSLVRPIESSRGLAAERNGKEGKGRDSSSPKPPSTPAPAAAADDETTAMPVKDQFDKIDAALRAIPGISDHPVAIDPVIAPVYQLVQRGLDLKTQIVPSITRQVQSAKRSIRRWSFFVPGIEQDANPDSAGPPPQCHAVDDEKWQRLLDIGRRKQQWDLKNYGPAPGQQGCRVPTHLLQPGDGDGWSEWRAAS